jgi:hypothetical protein
MEDLNQKQYSDYILHGILENFPFFKNYYYIQNDILFIEYPSRTGLLKLWITTQDIEVTIGLDNKDGNCEWHTHMSLYSAYEPKDELREIINLINRIFAGQELIVFNNGAAYYLTENKIEALVNKLPDDNLDFKKWHEI